MPTLTQIRADKLQELLRLRVQIDEQRQRVAEAERRRAAAELANVDVFAKLGFEPVCKPRVLARKSGVPEADLPEPCGTCPQERFLSAPDEDLDILYGGAGGGGKVGACWPTRSGRVSASQACRRSGSAGRSRSLTNRCCARWRATTTPKCSARSGTDPGMS